MAEEPLTNAAANFASAISPFAPNAPSTSLLRDRELAEIVAEAAGAAREARWNVGPKTRQRKELNEDMRAQSGNNGSSKATDLWS
jgi:hypothetical protein